MTELLKRAFRKASRLPPIDQNALGIRLLEEIRALKKWGNLFVESEDVLDLLADEAHQVHAKKKTKSLDTSCLS